MGTLKLDEIHGPQARACDLGPKEEQPGCIKRLQSKEKDKQHWELPRQRKCDRHNERDSPATARGRWWRRCQNAKKSREMVARSC